MKLLSVLFFLFSVSFGVLDASINGLFDSIKSVHIKSLKQKIFNKNRAVFQEEVEVLIDQKMHVWADKVTVNKETQILVAEKKEGGTVIFESNDFLILADKLSLNIAEKTGFAENIRIHIDEGYVTAAKAEKLDEHDWRMEDMCYTPCDAAHSHWHFKARKATLHGNYFIKTSGLVFNIGKVPVFALPYMVFPIQGRSKSGFLIPRFLFDYDYGFGFKQEYYKYFNPHADTTFAIDWRDRKGFVFSNEIRWARSSENFTMMQSNYAVSRNVFVERHGKIINATIQRYWVQGKDFRLWDFKTAQLASLLRVDFGTDKQIGYNFFNNTDDVDDSFFNSGIERLQWQRDTLELKLENIRTSRKRFSDLSVQEINDHVIPFRNALIAAQEASAQSAQTAQLETAKLKTAPIQKKELEDRVNTAYLPRIEWNSSYIIKKPFSYRHDFFVDQIFYRQEEIEKFYFNSLLINEESLIPLSKANLLRLGYKGNLQETFAFGGNRLLLYAKPQLDIRSKIAQDFQAKKNVFERRAFGKGAYRLFGEYGAEYVLPEVAWHNRDYTYAHYIQPRLTWDFLPKFFQDHWFYMDRWDRAYPKNQLELSLRNNWHADDFSIDCTLYQGYDFYDNKDIFCLRRGVRDKHLLPFRFDMGISSQLLHASVSQEHDWKNFNLLQSQIDLGLLYQRFHVSLGYLFQNVGVQQQRELLANIPHFMLLTISLPVTKHTTLSYDGQFYSEKNPHIFTLGTIKPLVHRIKFDYDGHCWGFYMGFEEKKYREYGNEKAERALVFSFRLESLGSFAKKIKPPQLVKLQTH